MATSPTVDPLERTVGVRSELFQDHPLKTLKRDALLFDQIVIPDLHERVSRLIHFLSHAGPGGMDELYWLWNIGIVRVRPPNLSTKYFHKPAAARQYMDAIAAETGEPIDAGAIPDEDLGGELWRRLKDLFEARKSDVVDAIVSRFYSIDLRLDGFNAFPIFERRRHIFDAFPSGTAPVLEVVLKCMPIPDDHTPWEDIIEFRNDPESMKQLRRLRVWVRKFAKDTTETSLAEMKEEVEVLLDEYEEHMKRHRMKVNKGATETLLAVAGKVAEDVVKLKWGELAKLPFILRERRISLLDAEAKAPNRELAFVSMARSRFTK